MLLSEAFNLYRENIVIFGGQSYKTEENLIASMKSLLIYIGNPPIEDLTIEQIRNYKTSLEKRGLSTGTIRGYLSKLRKVLDYLQKNNVICLNPELILLPRKEEKPIDFLTPEEVTVLIETAGTPAKGYPMVNRLRNQTIISMLFGSALRVGELCRLDRDSIYEQTFTAYGKGNKSRVAFIDDRTNILLDAYLRLRTDSNPALFLSNQTSARIKTGGVQRIMRGMGIKAGFTKPIHPHIFRHSFATDFYRNSGDLRSLQAILGHKDANTTIIYTHVTDPHLQRVYKAHHKV